VLREGKLKKDPINVRVLIELVNHCFNLLSTGGSRQAAVQNTAEASSGSDKAFIGWVANQSLVLKAFHSEMLPKRSLALDAVYFTTSQQAEYIQ